MISLLVSTRTGRGHRDSERTEGPLCSGSLYIFSKLRSSAGPANLNRLARPPRLRAHKGWSRACQWQRPPALQCASDSHGGVRGRVVNLKVPRGHLRLRSLMSRPSGYRAPCWQGALSRRQRARLRPGV